MATALLRAVVLLRLLQAAQASCSRYLGCYNDAPGDRDLPELVSLPLSDLTVHACVAACMGKGFAYAGLQNDAQSCWCGNTYGKHGAADSPSACNFACPGAPYELCGGDNGLAGPNSVYEVPADAAGLCGEGTCKADGTCDCGSSRSGLLCEVEGVCRFGPSYDWDALLRDSGVQDAYVRDMLTWDGRFATPGLGTTSAGLTCDHVDLNADGTHGDLDGDCGAAYTAASKESLNIGMLSLVVNRSHLAWHWIAGAANESQALGIAVDRLTRIIAAYEALDAQFPGLGGFLPWIAVSNAGFVLSSSQDVQIPALDNGELAWSIGAASTVLQMNGYAAVGQRYQAHFAKMAGAVNTLFLLDNGKAASGATVANASAPVSAGNRVRTGTSNYPYEGELMLMFMDMFGVWEGGTTRKELMWEGPRYYTRQTKELSDSRLPNGTITVQQGWRFSTHEMWKYFVLPYFDHPMALRVFMNGEKARTWNSHLNGIPGLFASAYTVDGSYNDDLGVESLSMGYTEPSSSRLMVTPYAAFAGILADRGTGLAWHRAMVSRPKMQSLLGSVEASQARSSPPGIAQKLSWDTKVTTDLAALGGLVGVLRLALMASQRYARFLEILDYNYRAWDQIPLSGEDNPFAPPPGLAASDDVPSPSPDFVSCARVSPRLTVGEVATPSPTPPPIFFVDNYTNYTSAAAQAGGGLRLMVAAGLLALWG